MKALIFKNRILGRVGSNFHAIFKVRIMSFEKIAIAKLPSNSLRLGLVKYPILGAVDPPISGVA